jgi:hypothetical protein
MIGFSDSAAQQLIQPERELACLSSSTWMYSAVRRARLIRALDAFFHREEVGKLNHHVEESS